MIQLLYKENIRSAKQIQTADKLKAILALLFND